jgi:putative flippase GtrA
MNEMHDANSGHERTVPVANRFFRFIVVGGIAAAVNFGSRIVLSRWLHYAPAIVVAYLAGLFIAFLLNRRFVFAEATNRLHHQMFWFIVVNVFALAQTLIVSLLFARYVLPYVGITQHNEEIAHAFGIVVPIFSSYIGHKRLSFSTRA